MLSASEIQPLLTAILMTEALIVRAFMKGICSVSSVESLSYKRLVIFLDIYTLINPLCSITIVHRPQISVREQEVRLIYIFVTSD